MVVPFFAGDEEVVFCAGVGAGLVAGAEELRAGFGGLDEKLVVADQANGFAVAVDRVLAEHLADADSSGSGDLLEDVLGGGGAGGHLARSSKSPSR